MAEAINQALRLAIIARGYALHRIIGETHEYRPQRGAQSIAPGFLYLTPNNRVLHGPRLSDAAPIRPCFRTALLEEGARLLPDARPPGTIHLAKE